MPARGVVPRSDPFRPCPLSNAQQRLWFLNQLEPASAFYNVGEALRLEGDLDLAALEGALNEIVRRHEALRTTFAAVNGEPVQMVSPDLVLPLPVVDLREISRGDREAETQRLAREEFRRPFDLARGPLVRFKALCVGEQEHVLLLTMHHIVCDRWSMDMFFRELSTLYEGLRSRKRSSLPDLPIQYADYALWQREWLHTEEVQGQLGYWKEQLGGDLPVLDLPTDRPRPPVLTFRGASRSLSLPAALPDALDELSREHGVTLFMVLLAAFQALLHRYTGQDDVIVGCPIAGRNRVETEGLIGFFVNTLALRTDLSGNPTFAELLARVREVTLGAYAHQDLPFEKLVEELQPERDLSRTPLFQVAFGLQDTPSQSLEVSGLSSSRVPVDTETAKFDLTLFVRKEADGMQCTLEYSSDLFDEDTIGRMLERLQRLLQDVVAEAGQRLSDLSLLSQAERRQVVFEWNNTYVPYPDEACVHQLFEAQVDQRPDAVAVSSGGEHLTYGELNRRANRLAHYLMRRGVGPDVPVGVCMRRSAEMVAAMLGILKAGGAYVPLDPEYPQQRLAFMLKDTQAPVVVTQRELSERLPAADAEPICLDCDAEAIARESEENPVGDARPDSLIYVIYTSGSTGEPKGVAIAHRAVIRLVINADYVRLTPDDAVAQAANSSFDAATFEIWGPLLNGARMVVIPKDVTLTPGLFATCLAEQRVSTLFLTTSLFNQLARALPSAFAGLRHLLFGGEAVDPRWVREVLEKGRPQRLLHVYGPTETTTFASWYAVEAVPEGAATIPIGRPIANTELYVLDASLQPVPIGVPGELFIGGPGLARCYVNQPELTAEKFIPHPFSNEPGARLYRTGDLARFLPDGNVEFLGRTDLQLKVRGFRVEPGEVEVVLAGHPSVAQAVVLAREDQAGAKRLVAYVVPDAGRPLEAGQLRRFLQQRLPDFMVPSAFVTLDVFPLTATGKVDRQALPPPQPAPPRVGRTSSRPRNPLEHELSRMWEDALGVEGIGIGDNFFELGGHSLLAARVFAQVEQVFGKQLPLAAFFQEATIENLAGLLRRRDWQGTVSSLVPIRPQGHRIPAFFVTPVDPWLFRHLARRLGADQPFYALRPPLGPGYQMPAIEVEPLASRYVAELRAVRPEGPYVLGGLSAGGFVALEMARQLMADGQQVPVLILLDTSARRPRMPLLTRLRALAFLRLLGSLIRVRTPGQMRQIVDRVRTDQRRKLRRLARRGRRRFSSRARRKYGQWLRHAQLLIRAHGRAVARYRLRRYPGRIVQFFARDTSVARLRDSRLDWGQVAGGGFDVYVVPGDHHHMLEEPDVQPLARQLRACLDEVQRAPSAAARE